MIKAEPSEEGRKQFYEVESFGKKPEKPDPYYLRLCDGVMARNGFNGNKPSLKKPGVLSGGVGINTGRISKTSDG